MKKTQKTKLTALLLVLVTLFSALFIPVGAVNISETVTNFGSEEIMPMSTFYCSQHEALRAAKRSVNIPMSAQPTSTESEWVIGADGRYYESVTEYYGNKYIRADIKGHTFLDGSTIDRHYNAGYINDDGTTTDSSTDGAERMV